MVQHSFGIDPDSLAVLAHYKWVGLLNPVIVEVFSIGIWTYTLPEYLCVNWVYVTVAVMDLCFGSCKRHTWHVFYCSFYVASHPAIGDNKFYQFPQWFVYIGLWCILGLRGCRCVRPCYNILTGLLGPVTSLRRLWFSGCILGSDCRARHSLGIFSIALGPLLWCWMAYLSLLLIQDCHLFPTRHSTLCGHPCWPSQSQSSEPSWTSDWCPHCSILIGTKRFCPWLDCRCGIRLDSIGLCHRLINHIGVVPSES